MTRPELIEALCVRSNLPAKVIRGFLDGVLEEMKSDLLAGKTIELRGFGTFEIVKRKGRERARNPKTGETVSVQDHGVARFKPGKELKSEAWGKLR